MLSGISVPSLLLILLIVVLLFGTKKLRSLGSDLGAAIRSFRQAAREEDPGELPAGGGANKPLEKNGEREER